MTSCVIVEKKHMPNTYYKYRHYSIQFDSLYNNCPHLGLGYSS